MNSTKKYLFVLFLFLTLIPCIQSRFPFVVSAPLKGAFQKAEIPEFSWASWISGNFQTKFDKGVEQNFGLRNSFVRLNNQINYSLFNISNAKTVIVGKEGYLYEEAYINSYLGNDRVNENANKLRIAKAKFVQDELEKRGKHLLIILAPGKASYYPEYIPARYNPENKKISNYDIYSALLPKSGLNYIDFNGYFKKLKNKSPYPLYPKQGIHWSVYGGTIALDSIVNYIRFQFNMDLPHVTFSEIETVDTLRDSDYDIGAGMNLMFQMPHNKMGYPKIKFENNSGKFRPNVLTIGDSYYWMLVTLGLHAHVFNNDNFWYYNKVDYYDYGKQKPVDYYELGNELKKENIILIIQTEPYYGDIGMGFIEVAYELLKNKNNGI